MLNAAKGGALCGAAGGHGGALRRDSRGSVAAKAATLGSASGAVGKFRSGLLPLVTAPTRRTSLFKGIGIDIALQAIGNLHPPLLGAAVEQLDHAPP